MRICLLGFMIIITDGPKLKTISLQHLLVFPFPDVILLSVAVVSYLSMGNGHQAVNSAALQKGTP
jgi:hypothetical protein